MAKRSVRREITQIDPLFPIPDGVDELVYRDDGEVSLLEILDDAGLGVDDLDGAFDDTNYENDPDTPQIIGIVSQLVRRTSVGNSVVDVIFEVEDIAGVTDYELRVTEA